MTRTDPNPITRARWQLAHALGRLDAIQKFPESCPLTLENLAPVIAELEIALIHIKTADDAQPLEDR